MELKNLLLMNTNLKVLVEISPSSKISIYGSPEDNILSNYIMDSFIVYLKRETS